jgi:hypothetical protein
VLIADEPGCPNAAFAGLCARSPDLHTTLVLHGTKVALAKRILRRGFDPTRVRRMYIYIVFGTVQRCHVDTYVLRSCSDRHPLSVCLCGRQIQSGGDEGSRESVFYFGTDPGIVDRSDTIHTHLLYQSCLHSCVPLSAFYAFSDRYHCLFK